MDFRSFGCDIANWLSVAFSMVYKIKTILDNSSVGTANDVGSIPAEGGNFDRETKEGYRVGGGSRVVIPQSRKAGWLLEYLASAYQILVAKSVGRKLRR